MSQPNNVGDAQHVHSLVTAGQLSDAGGCMVLIGRHLLCSANAEDALRSKARASAVTSWASLCLPCCLRRSALCSVAFACRASASVNHCLQLQCVPSCSRYCINLLTESAGRVILQFARCQEVLWFTPLPKNLSLLYFSTCMQAHLQQEHCPAGVDYCPGRNYLVPDAAKGP